MFRSQVPVILQSESNECGLACLAMLLGYHGRATSLPDLRQFNPGGQALPLNKLVEIAHGLGFTSRALRCEPQDLVDVDMPAIVHLDFDHYAVITRSGNGRVIINDPGRGQVTLSMNDFSRRFTGILLELSPSTTFQASDVVIDYSPITMIRHLPLQKITRSLASLLMLSICVQVFALATPFYLQIIVDDVITNQNPEFALIVVGGFAGVYLLSAVCQWLRGLLIIHLGNHLSWRLAIGLFKHLVHLPVSYFDRRTVGDVSSRFRSLTAMQEFITSHAVRMALDLLMITGTMIILVAYDGTIALFLATCIVVYLALQYLLTLPFRRYSHEQIVADAHSQQHFIESVQSMNMIRRHEIEPGREQGWSNRLVVAINANVRASQVSLLSEITRYLLGAIIVLGTVWLALDRINSALMTIGMLYAMMTYTNHLTGAILSITEGWQRYLVLPIHVQRLSDILDHPVDASVKLATHASSSSIRVLDIDYRHPGATAPLIEGLSFSASENSKIAIVGPSGCGKSTLFYLLLGELRPDQGEIVINGRPLGKHLSSISATASLFQHDQLIDGTVMDNIALNDSDPDHKVMAQAAQIACIHEDIMRLPMAWLERLHTFGQGLSAGQRQRILLARTIYRKIHCNKPIMLLDESTCHLNDDLEYKVMQNILALPGICIFITHRHDIAALADYDLPLGHLPSPSTAAQSQSGMKI